MAIEPMTDERLAEYEQLIKGWCPSSDPDDVCVELLQALKAERAEVERLREVNERISATLKVAEKDYKHRIGELQAEVERLRGAEAAGLELCRAIGKECPEAENLISELQAEVERLRGEPVVGLCIDHAGIYVTDKKCPYCKLTRLLEGLDDAVSDWQEETQEPCEDRENYAINGAYQACLHRIQALIKEARQ